jgi:hypothetical protein
VSQVTEPTKQFLTIVRVKVTFWTKPYSKTALTQLKRKDSVWKEDTCDIFSLLPRLIKLHHSFFLLPTSHQISNLFSLSSFIQNSIQSSFTSLSFSHFFFLICIFILFIFFLSNYMIFFLFLEIWKIIYTLKQIN